MHSGNMGKQGLVPQGLLETLGEGPGTGEPGLGQS